MTIESLSNLLDKVSILNKHYQRIARITGEHFNVFKTLGLETSEVRMHSSLLAEFLNPNGSHGQGSVFLELFLNQFKNSYEISFDISNATVEVEKYIGRINEQGTEGGRIDILLTDRLNNHIIIENKIYARDQEKQIIRYFNFDKEAIIFYLTLDGKAPSKASAEQVKVIQISYRKHILNWLAKCKKEAVSLPIIRETISQYANLIKSLTNQSLENGMKEELKSLLYEKPENIDAMDLVAKYFPEIVNEAIESFKSLLEKVFDYNHVFEKAEIIIEPLWGDDCDGFWFGYRFKNSNNELCQSNQAFEIYEKIKEKMNWSSEKSDTNGGFIFWFYPENFRRGKKLADLDKHQIIDWLKETTSMETVIKKMVEDEKIVRDELKLIAESISWDSINKR
jgi:hypothetical protein